jgi:hypothetical protein
VVQGEALPNSSPRIVIVNRDLNPNRDQFDYARSIITSKCAGQQLFAQLESMVITYLPDNVNPKVLQANSDSVMVTPVAVLTKIGKIITARQNPNDPAYEEILRLSGFIGTKQANQLVGCWKGSNCNFEEILGFSRLLFTCGRLNLKTPALVVELNDYLTLRSDPL